MNVWKLISEGELFTIWLHCSPKSTTKVCHSMNDWLSVKPTGERPLDVDKCEGGPNTSHAQGRRTKRRDAAVKTSWLLNTLNNHSPTQKLVTYIYIAQIKQAPPTLCAALHTDCHWLSLPKTRRIIISSIYHTIIHARQRESSN